MKNSTIFSAPTTKGSKKKKFNYKSKWYLLITNEWQKRSFIINSSIFFALIIGIGLVPENLFSDVFGIDLKKIITIIFAVALIQLIGMILLKVLNSHAGVALHGFISGLISSTALTVTLSKKSKYMTQPQREVETLSFLSATLAMLIQGVFLAYITTNDLPWKTWLLFLVPMVTTIALMIRRSIHTQHIHLPKEEISLKWSPILKLALFICIILSLSSHAKNLMGNLGLQIVTFMISLFEIHGSIVSTTQMFSANKLTPELYSTLISISIFASYFSKLAIIYTTAHKYFKKKATIWVGLVLLSLILCVFY